MLFIYLFLVQDHYLFQLHLTPYSSEWVDQASAITSHISQIHSNFRVEITKRNISKDIIEKYKERVTFWHPFKATNIGFMSEVVYLENMKQKLREVKFSDQFHLSLI